MATSSPSEDMVETLSAAKLTDATRPQSITFLSLPYDVRLPIYKTILISDQDIMPEARKDLIHEPRPICGPNYLPPFHTNLDRYFDTFSHLEGQRPTINVRFLCTCSTVYEEALPVLYSQNKFVFTGRATTKSDLDRLISGRARAHLAFVILHPTNRCLNQICRPCGPYGDFDTLWQGLCFEFAGIRRINLSFVPENGKVMERMSEKLVRFMTHIALDMDHGCRTDLLPKMVAKVEIGKVRDEPALSSLISEQYRKLSRLQRTRVRHETLYTPRGATIELNAVLARSVITRLAEVCEGRWTSLNLNNGLLDDTVTVGSVVEMTLTKFRTTAPLYDGPVVNLDARSGPVWDGYDPPSCWPDLG